MVTDTRIRLERATTGARPCSKINRPGVRKLLLKAATNLTSKERTRLQTAFDNDPTGHLHAAWTTKELFRNLCHTGLGCNGTDRHAINRALTTFYTHCAESNVPEATTFARTIDTWLDPLLAAFETGLTNALSEGINRLIKQVKRVGCGFTNTHRYINRVRLHHARTRHTRRTRATAKHHTKPA